MVNPVASSHQSSACVINGHIVSGGQQVEITWQNQWGSAGQASDGSVWVLMKEPAHYPRRDFRNFVHYTCQLIVCEPNGLVRLVQINDQEAGLALITHRLSHQSEDEDDLEVGNPIPEGLYNGIRIRIDQERYVMTGDKARIASLLKGLAAEQDAAGAWRVDLEGTAYLRARLFRFILPASSKLIELLLVFSHWVCPPVAALFLALSYLVSGYFIVGVFAVLLWWAVYAFNHQRLFQYFINTHLRAALMRTYPPGYVVKGGTGDAQLSNFYA